MFNIKEESNFSRQERLLFNVWKTLQTFCDKKEAHGVVEVITEDVTIDIPEPIEEKEHKYTCKICNTGYDSKGHLMLCYKKHKKEGVHS